jgi:hypothetical protein
MTEQDRNNEGGNDLDLLYGLESYCELKNLKEDFYQVHELINVYTSPDIQEALRDHVLRQLVRLNPTNSFFRATKSYVNQGQLSLILDGFSRSQVTSKRWLVETLKGISNNWGNIAIMAGWFGQMVEFLDSSIAYNKIRVVELDSELCRSSDQVFNLSRLEGHRVKSVCADINQLTLYKTGYEWDVKNFRDDSVYSEKFLPKLIINTSAEHMTEEWFHQLRFKQMESDPIVAIQSNNLFDLDEHVNCVHSVDHMKKKFPMREVLFAGELQLKGYKRVMLIGKP